MDGYDGKDYRVRPEKIRHTRMRQRLTQQDLASRAGMSLGQLSRIEGGKIPSPHFSTIDKIAEVLGIDSDDLIEWRLPVSA